MAIVLVPHFLKNFINAISKIEEWKNHKSYLETMKVYPILNPELDNQISPDLQFGDICLFYMAVLSWI